MKKSLTMKDINNVVACAVNWWVTAISGNADEITQEKMEDFKSCLIGEVKVGLALEGYVTLQTDLYPEGVLAKAAYISFIKGSVFPKKTFMDITPREVGIRQNHSKREVLFANYE